MTGAALALALLAAQDAAPITVLPAARRCSADEIAALIAPASRDAPPYRLLCRAALLPGTTVSRRILIEGAEASGAGLDCAGGSVGAPGAVTTTDAPTIAVWSRAGDAGWSRPTDITVTDCTVHGAIRIWGMGAGGSMRDLLGSSRTADHTHAAQTAAPTRIALTGVHFAATGSIPLYVGPGVTEVRVTGAQFTGRSVSTAVYLDAESARNLIQHSTFDIRTAREQIAVDGSADNWIVGNRFVLGGRGGVFLYRNCGEDAVIRHQTPSGNVVADNVFTGAARLRPRTVVVGAREGNRRYCGDDAGWPYGSSADDGDRAVGNVVERNRTIR